MMAKKNLPVAYVIEDGCSGCAGAPMCITVCPVTGSDGVDGTCIEYVESDAGPFGQAVILEDTCIGCRICETYCPWETIVMVKDGLQDRETRWFDKY